MIRYSNKNNQCLVCLVLNSTHISNNVIEFSHLLFNSFKNITGVCVNLNSKLTNVILGNETKCIVGDEYVEEEICSKTFLIGADTFFQINPLSAQNIFNYVKDFINNTYTKPTILDAYAGISAIGICLSDLAKQVVSIEENLKSVDLACKTAKLNNIENIEINGGDAAKFFKNEKRLFDIIVLDPPRKGCSIDSLNYSLKLCKGHIIYISCNPATLARDLAILKEKGCKIESIQPFDMFCHTYHIENVAIIKV